MNKKADDWMDTAERIGNDLAKGLESLGTRVQQALESLDDLAQRPNHGVTVEDERTDLSGVEVGGLLRGDCFEHDEVLCMRLGSIPGQMRSDDVLVVELRNGNVRPLPRALRVTPVDVRVTVRERDA